jgi:hypothetical protein
VKEIRIMLENIDANTMIISDSASNLLQINGALPDERDLMLSVIDEYQHKSKRDKLIFSLESRLDSFIGQYGELSMDILKSIAPYVKNGALDTSCISDDELASIIHLVRSKLMP